MMDGTRAFNLSVTPDIQDLTEQVLDKEEANHARNIIEALLQIGHRARAIKELRDLIGTVPKRPVYYLYVEIRELPDKTRNVVRDAGDFIDQAIKHCAHEKGRYLFNIKVIPSLSIPDSR